jgi:hypothetical protein
MWFAQCNSRRAVFYAWPVPYIYNESVALLSTESRTKGMGIQHTGDRIGELGRIEGVGSPRN